MRLSVRWVIVTTSALTVIAGGSPETARHRYVQEMQDRLKLTRAQVSQLEAIMRDTRAKTHAARDTIQPQMLQIKHDHIERIKSILTPQQVPEYEKLVAEREQRSRDQEERDHNTH